MLKENDTSVSTQSAETEPQKVTQETQRNEEVSDAKPKGLSRRDALEVAIEATKPESKEKVADVAKADSTGRVRDDSGKFSKTSARSGERSAEPAKSDGGIPPLEPPAEYTADEKADFTQLSRKGQEAQLRLHKARQGKIEEIHAKMREFDHVKNLATSVDPFVKAMGIKDKPEVALQKALKMWREFEDAADPRTAAAAYLRAKGIEPPKEWTANGAKENSAPDPKLAAMQERIDMLTKRVVSEDQSKIQAVVSSAWESVEQENNAAGKPKFPDMNNSESGLKLASNIASLVNGVTDISKQFIAHAKERIPSLDYPTLIKEAYRYCGGKVDDSEAPRSQTTQTHIAQSRRAAASVPGKSAGSAIGTQVKFKTYRQAAAKALADLKEAEQG